MDQTPFRVLLSTDVNLLRDAKIVDVEEEEDRIAITLEDKNAETSGQLKLFLSTKPDLELKQWVTKDAQGIETRVEVSDLAKGVELDAEIFKIQAYAWVE